MRDSRVTIFNSGAALTVSADGTTTGDTIDLLQGYEVGSYFEGAPSEYGIGVEIMLSTVTGTAFNVEIYWETSDDNSTFVRDALVLESSADPVALIAASNGGTKMIVPTRLTSKRRYARLKVVTTNMSSESFVLQGWLSDGTPSLAYGGDNIRY
jgi:hypothetical protein